MDSSFGLTADRTCLRMVTCGDLWQLQHTLVSDTSAAEGAKVGTKEGGHIREELITEPQS